MDRADHGAESRPSAADANKIRAELEKKLTEDKKIDTKAEKAAANTDLGVVETGRSPIRDFQISARDEVEAEAALRRRGQAGPESLDPRHQR